MNCTLLYNDPILDPHRRSWKKEKHIVRKDGSVPPKRWQNQTSNHVLSACYEVFINLEYLTPNAKMLGSLDGPRFCNHGQHEHRERDMAPARFKIAQQTY